ncbi:hypothetical protein [Bacteriovorax sp. Seq25_V]|uniref:hypothetical protein n=1 Tax=Bacteriovorax sp. Seq25_V TaxID=1201288 RepID=UPI00055297C3|nr:hypothetical protein [Bacteriovorax sp. Seq25_V]
MLKRCWFYILISFLASCATTKHYTYKSQNKLYSTEHGFMYRLKHTQKPVTYYYNFDYTDDTEYLKLHLLIENNSNKDIIFSTTGVSLTANGETTLPLDKDLILKNLRAEIKSKQNDVNFRSDVQLLDDLSSTLHLLATSSTDPEYIEKQKEIKEKENQIEQSAREIRNLKQQLNIIKLGMAEKELNIAPNSSSYSFIYLDPSAKILESKEARLKITDELPRVPLTQLQE